MVKQITYIIVNDKKEMVAGVTTDCILWTGLITRAVLFENRTLAERANEYARGVIMRMKYDLEQA